MLPDELAARIETVHPDLTVSYLDLRFAGACGQGVSAVARALRIDTTDRTARYPVRELLRRHHALPPHRGLDTVRVARYLAAAVRPGSGEHSAYLLERAGLTIFPPYAKDTLRVMHAAVHAARRAGGTRRRVALPPHDPWPYLTGAPGTFPRTPRVPDDWARTA